MLTLNHGDKVFIGGLHCTIHTLSGYLLSNRGMTVEEYFALFPVQKNYDHKPVGLYIGSIMFGSNQEWELHEAKWKNAIPLESGDEVVIEGTEYIAQFKGVVSEAIAFIKKTTN